MKYLIGLILLFFVACNRFTPEDLAFTLIQAKQNGSPTPLVTEIVPRLTPDQAYYIQNAWLEKMLPEDVLFGFKAGATSEAARQQFNLEEPVGGLLLESGRLFPNDTLASSRLLRPMAEIELAFRFNAYTEGPIPNVDSLKKCIDSVYLAVEIPDLGFESIRPFNAADLIAANVGASYYVVPQQGMHPDSLDWKSAHLQLIHEGSTLLDGKGHEAYGDPWKAVLWLANQYISKEYVIGKGQHLFTGAIGGMTAAKKGYYEAYLNDQKVFEFHID